MIQSANKKMMLMLLMIGMIWIGAVGLSADAATATKVEVVAQSGKTGEIVPVWVEISENANILNGLISIQYPQDSLEYIDAQLNHRDGMVEVYNDAVNGVLNIAFIYATPTIKLDTPFTAMFRIKDNARSEIALFATVKELVTINDVPKPHTMKQGVIKPNFTGWIGDYHYINGVMSKSKWVGEYYVDASGRCQYNKWIGDYYVGGNGAYYINKWAGDYYCGADGKYVKKAGWIGDYYVDASGKCQYNKWIGDYYVGSNGKKAINRWVSDYYCGADGKYVKKAGWIGEYYVDASGKCQYNKWVGVYYVGANGKYLRNAWLSSIGNWYYFKADGKYATGTIQIGAKTEKFSAKGIWLK